MEALFASLPMIGFMYIFYLVPISFAVIAYRKFRDNDEQFRNFDLLLLVVPHVVWWVLLLSSSQGKSLSNAVVEPAALGMASSIVLLVRLLPGYPGSRVGVLASIAIPILAAVCIWFLVPELPE